MAKTGKRDQKNLKEWTKHHEKELELERYSARRDRALTDGLNRVRNGETVEAIVESFGDIGKSIANDLRNEHARLN